MANTKKSLLFSALSLLLCCALLVGTTFAWFTDSVTNTGNKIQAGDLKISAVMYDLQNTAFGDNEVEVLMQSAFWDCGLLMSGADTLDLGKGDYFALGFAKEGTDFEGSDAFISDTLFEPGKTYVRQLRIKNDGSLAAKVKLQFDITDNSLSDALWFAVLDIKEANGRQRVSTINETLDSIELSLTPNNYEDLVFVFGMDEEAGNEYMNKSFAASLSIYATQYTHEKDGFGSNQYDKDAVFSQKNVEYDESMSSAENGAVLEQAISDVADGGTVFIGAGTYALDVLEIGDKNLTIVGEDGVVFERVDEGFITIRGAENASMTVRGISFAGETANDTSGTRGICFSGQANSNVTLTVEDCRFSNLTTGIFLGGVANATITGCSFTDCFAGIGGSENITGTLAVDNCSFSGNTENIGWAGAGEIVITNSPSCDSYMDYTKNPAEKVNLRAEVTAYDDPAVNSAALSDAVESVGDGGTVFVSGNYELASGISVNKDVSFIGKDGAVISGAPITASANVTFKNITLEKPTNSNSNASLIYGYAGCETIVLENCVFNDPQWEVIQITSKDLKSLVITGCTFTAADVDGAESGYGNSANQAIRYIHIQPRSSDNVVADITITNNKFMDCENVVDSVVGIFYIAEGSTLTVGGNTFEGLEPEADGSTEKLCFGWPCMDGIDNINAWTGAEQTFTYPG